MTVMSPSASAFAFNVFIIWTKNGNSRLATDIMMVSFCAARALPRAGTASAAAKLVRRRVRRERWIIGFSSPGCRVWALLFALPEGDKVSGAVWTLSITPTAGFSERSGSIHRPGEMPGPVLSTTVHGPGGAGDDQHACLQDATQAGCRRGIPPAPRCHLARAGGLAEGGRHRRLLDLSRPTE